MNPDQRESLERKNPHRYGGLGLVSIYVHECQTLLFCVNLYCSKPIVIPSMFFWTQKGASSTDSARISRAGIVVQMKDLSGIFTQP